VTTDGIAAATTSTIGSPVVEVDISAVPGVFCAVADGLACERTAAALPHAVIVTNTPATTAARILCISGSSLFDPLASGSPVAIQEVPAEPILVPACGSSESSKPMD
jgi:hypothetical protein